MYKNYRRAKIFKYNAQASSHCRSVPIISLLISSYCQLANQFLLSACFSSYCYSLPSVPIVSLPISSYCYSLLISSYCQLASVPIVHPLRTLSGIHKHEKFQHLVILLHSRRCPFLLLQLADQFLLLQLADQFLLPACFSSYRYSLLISSYCCSLLISSYCQLASVPIVTAC